MHDLATNLRQARTQAGLTQAELAQRAGLPRASLANMEGKNDNPGIESVLAVANALNISVDELLTSKPSLPYFKVPASDVREFRNNDGLFVARQLSPVDAQGIQIQSVTMFPGCNSIGRPHPRGALEFYYCLSGVSELCIAGHEVSVEAGALVQFPGHVHHVYRNPARDQIAQGMSLVAFPRT